jgi:hypothetical protein
MRRIDINAYVTGVSTEASVDSPPGSATINLSIPDNDVNDFYSDGSFIIIPMMEIELFAKGYYTIGGFPQYYKIFWGLVSSVSKSWSNGVTSISISCKDILRWWELTNTITNAAFLEISKTSNAGYNLYGNQFAGMNPMTVIISLAKEAMGDASINTGSFTSFKPEDGPEKPAIAAYAKDVMLYWQLKFSNIWNSLVIYGTSGQAYTFAGKTATVSPLDISKQIFTQEQKNLGLIPGSGSGPPTLGPGNNPLTNQFTIQPSEIAAFKQDLNKAGDFDFFQHETQSKLAIAMTARDQAGYEFYCDTTGDIIFKPPFYNLNVIPNKPTSWIQNFEIIDDNVTDSEAEVYTHITSSGNAFGGVWDPGLNDEITTPRTGVIDYHLLRRYGWRRLDYQCEWAGNPNKLFYHLLDYLDRVNSKRQNGTVTIPMRPELRMGFPIWFPKYDSFFYIQGISHNYSPGGQATTTLTLTAKRSKFIAPVNIGSIKKTGSVPMQYTDPINPKKAKISVNVSSYTVDFPSSQGSTANLGTIGIGTNDESGGPAIIRDPNTGNLLGYPNAVMVYRKTFSPTDAGSVVLQKAGSTLGNKPTTQNIGYSLGSDGTYAKTQTDILNMLHDSQRAEAISRLRAGRYESGMSNAGVYDYAHDETGEFKQFSVVPASAITWGSGTDGGPDKALSAVSVSDAKARTAAINANVTAATAALKPLTVAFNTAMQANQVAQANLAKNPSDPTLQALAATAKSNLQTASQNLQDGKAAIAAAKANKTGTQVLPSINIMVRPVSDEFGFELIGHYRYGRGVFINLNQVSLTDPNTNATANQINIQFAPTGGLLTNNPNTGLGGTTQSFSQQFEQLQPSDYATAGSFNGANYTGSGGPSQDSITMTNPQTYTSSISNAITSTGQAVFAEADATKNAQLLSSISPSFTLTSNDTGNTCSCAIGNSNWLSVLPKTLIQQVLRPGPATQITPPPGAPPPGSDQPVSVTDILVTAGGSASLPETNEFFQALHDYLSGLFVTNYQENLTREQFEVNGARSPIDLATEDAQGGPNSIDSGLLGAPNNALFDRAAAGDPDAIAAIKAGSLGGFGGTIGAQTMAAAAQGLQQFNQSITSANQQAQQAFSGITLQSEANSLGGARFSGPNGTTSYGNLSPPAQGPNLSMVLNPNKISPEGVDTFSFRTP